MINITIRKQRQKLHMTQRELAGLIGVSPSQVSRWELDKEQPGEDDIVKLAEVLGDEIRVECKEEPDNAAILFARLSPEGKKWWRSLSGRFMNMRRECLVI